ncbi:MAG: ComEA family DNA-binding protein [candidate division WOR-3 bacterium]|nr:ComEA family DNA-binding protein [candidate division WOR-3 bacterium]
MIAALIIIFPATLVVEPSLGYWVSDVVKEYYSVDCVILPYEFFSDSSRQINDSLIKIHLNYHQLESLFIKNFKGNELWAISGLKVQLSPNAPPKLIITKKNSYLVITTKSLTPNNNYKIIKERIGEIIKNYLAQSIVIKPPKLNRYDFLAKSEELNKININTASLEELIKLPGIGPKTAQAILDYRTKYGPFKKINEIKKVKGIGEKKYEKIKALISVD